ncbi:MAG: hypothetical protein IJ106_03430 [Parasporobacterium sp.]|nr:hypothetical protein [Parasporobacterium sp.]
MTMEKMVIFHNLLDENLRPAMGRWFRRSHVPDVLTLCPWTKPVSDVPAGGSQAYSFLRIYAQEADILNFVMY